MGRAAILEIYADSLVCTGSGVRHRDGTGIADSAGGAGIAEYAVDVAPVAGERNKTGVEGRAAILEPYAGDA